MHTPTGTSDDEPRVRDAVIGAAFGVLLIYLGTLIPVRLVRWPVLGCGILFVIVMVGFVLVTFWKQVSPHVRRQLDKALGRVRNDPQLGTLTRNVKGEYWQASLMSRDRSVDVIIDGEDEPNPALLARARAIVANFDVLEARLAEYLASEAVEDPEFAAEIRALRVSTILLRLNDHPNRAMIDFEGPDEMRYWYCDYVDGELSGLTFD